MWRRKDKPGKECKKQRWVRGLRSAPSRLRAGVRASDLGDGPGGGIFELFVEQRRLKAADLLVRAKHNRRLGKKRPKLSG